MTISFVILGKPVGYTNMGGAGRFFSSKRKRVYIEYKKQIQALLPPGLVSLTASKDHPVKIKTEAYFINGTHPDPESIHRGVKDAIFYGKKGGDKYTSGQYAHPLYDKTNPRVEVTVSW